MDTRSVIVEPRYSLTPAAAAPNFLAVTTAAAQKGYLHGFTTKGYGAPALASVALLGVVLGLSYEYSGGLWLGVATHATWNAVSLIGVLSGVWISLLLLLPAAGGVVGRALWMRSGSNRRSRQPGP